MKKILVILALMLLGMAATNVYALDITYEQAVADPSFEGDPLHWPWSSQGILTQGTDPVLGDYNGQTTSGRMQSILLYNDTEFDGLNLNTVYVKAAGGSTITAELRWFDDFNHRWNNEDIWTGTAPDGNYNSLYAINSDQDVKLDSTHLGRQVYLAFSSSTGNIKADQGPNPLLADPMHIEVNEATPVVYSSGWVYIDILPSNLTLTPGSMFDFPVGEEQEVAKVQVYMQRFLDDLTVAPNVIGATGGETGGAGVHVDVNSYYAQEYRVYQDDGQTYLFDLYDVPFDNVQSTYGTYYYGNSLKVAMRDGNPNLWYVLGDSDFYISGDPINPVPEPATIISSLLGLLGFAVKRFIRK